MKISHKKISMITPAQAGAGIVKETSLRDLYQHVQQQLLKANLTDAKEDPLLHEPEGLAPASLQGLYDLPQEQWCQAPVKEEGC